MRFSDNVAVSNVIFVVWTMTVESNVQCGRIKSILMRTDLPQMGTTSRPIGQDPHVNA